MARNRKRAKERRARQAPPFASSQNGAEDDDANPLAHAAPDVELAEAQLALGRPELSAEHNEEEDAENLDELKAEVEASRGGPGGGASGASGGDGDGSGGSGLEPSAHPPGHAPVHAPGIFGRLINFLQGSWRELQRVQWPDRRQVMQATGVVIGFVIVAGVFLGVADFLAGHLMNYVLEGHW